MAERSNRTIVEEIKKRMFPGRKNWNIEFEDILWAYRTTRREPTGQTPFFMVYGTDPISPIEIQIPTIRVAKADIATNDQNLVDHGIFLDEWRSRALMRLEACARKIARHYNKKVRPRDFEIGDLVLRRSIKKGKLDANLEGPYIICAKLRGGAYSIANLDGEEIKHTWNASHLIFFYPE